MAPKFDDSELAYVKRVHAARRVAALIKLEAGMETCRQAIAEIAIHTPASHSAQKWLKLARMAIYADNNGDTRDGTLFTLQDNLETLSRLE